MAVPKQIERAIFDAALEIDDSQMQTDFLEQACNENHELKSRLEKLLAVQSSAERFFKTSPIHEIADIVLAPVEGEAHSSGPKPSSPETINTVIGRYRLSKRLGEGGCGVVYLAEQQHPVRRRVALKIIRLGMDTESVIARFEAERQALAMMGHPNIAQVLDAGATESGRPYFVMDLVEGVKITDYCNQKNLDTRQRLGFFIQVCQAIQHAHQKGIIHRDIKPSNILVAMHDGVSVPKVIDFGIAKAVEGRLTDNELQTASDQFIGTPAYMSPEQAEMGGLDVDTRSDIYSLGVLLYELLTGQTPFDSKELVKDGVDEMRRTLREQEPQPPSTLLTTLGNTKLHTVALQHHAEPLRLISTVRGDLDWIVMKALEKNRSRRYETANGLAMDVQRFLDNEPIIARPPSRFYRFQKLARRNWIVFSAIFAVMLSLLAGASVSIWLFLQERYAHQQAVAAEQQQARLREESDRLRQQAEFQQKLSEAILARRLDKIEESDCLVAGIPAPAPKLEYADLYRDLGEWHVANHRWKKAADRFAALVQVNQPDDWDVTTLDYLRYGPLLLEVGDTNGYEKFRSSAVKHFAPTSNPVPVERVLKVSLLMPVSAGLLADLRPMAALASNSLVADTSNDGWNRSLKAWRSFSLALFEYRQRNYASVAQWYQKSLDFQQGNVIREVNLEIVLAMAHYQMGMTDQARRELSPPRQKVGDWVNGTQMTDGDMGYWFDWVFARVLLREATTLMEDGHYPP